MRWGTARTALAVVALLQAPAGVWGQTVRSDTLRAPGLDEAVEILKDRWGVSHIYAQTEHDLFYAQGYSAARDRAFQLELWRRQATGTLAEILGPEEVERDHGTRLFMFRGDLEAELNHYHPRGKAIIEAYVEGVNARVAETLEHPDLLPVEFEMLDIEPGFFTPAVVISRHQGLLGNIGEELRLGRAVARGGENAVRRVSWFQPQDPILTLDPAIDGDLLFHDILRLYDAFRTGVRFQAEDVVARYRRGGVGEEEDRAAAAFAGRLEAPPLYPGLESDPFMGPTVDNMADIGSNNWVVGAALSESGYPLMANDPHRAQAAPSLRYMVHLNGPGWDVIGGGEPAIPGVSIGHNGYGAWGLTVFRTDGEDLYVYETDPSDGSRYRYGDGWESMTSITEVIEVEGADPVEVELFYTRHGPVVYQDREHNRAYAIRAAWMEVGGAPYLASLRMDQARTWEEFREACSYSNIPGENMIWADRTGTIGWQSVGIAPIRRTWSGMVPVPGDGRYEWDGYLPILDKPGIVNPAQGFFASANNHLTPLDYERWDAITFTWTDPYRWARASEVLGSGRRFSMTDMMALQTDVHSIPARTLVPMLDGLSAPNPAVENARLRLLDDWDYDLDAGSVRAGIYAMWERELRDLMHARMVPADLHQLIPSIPMKKVIDWMISPPGDLGPDPLEARDTILIESLSSAVAQLVDKLGSVYQNWEYGQPDYKHALLHHPLSLAVDDETRAALDVGPAPRGGNSYTLNNTGNGDNQTSGASFRIIVDTSDWDRTVAVNTPGQGGNPRDPHYRDLFDLWANDEFFPLFYSRDQVEAVTGARTILAPE